MNGESKITGEHRSRCAVVYVRQSTMVQVRDHTESTARQYGLAEVAIALGWTQEQVVVIDADLGISGRFGVDRAGFREVLSRVCLGEVGAILGLEVSRLARSSAEFARLLELARLTDTLLIDGDGVYDLRDVNDRLLLGLKGSMSEVELHLLSGRLHGAKLALARRGELRSPLSVGYVYDSDGSQVKDPDEQVRDAVAAVFAEFDRTGSAFGVVGAFAQAGRLFPQRAYGGAWAGQLRWGRLGHHRVLQILHNPAYAGAYCWGRSVDGRRVQPDGAVRSSRRKRAREDWTVLIGDHHEGYLSWAQFLDNEAKLAANHTARGARPPREGITLCQGIIRCGGCGAIMNTRYHGHRAFYYCVARREHTQSPLCRAVAVGTIDDAVAALLLETITPAQINAALAVAEEVIDRHTRGHRAAELAVERARYEADRAERTFEQVEPENRLVARTLESRWETKLAALAEAEAALATMRAARPPLPPRSALQALAADLPGLWNDPNTAPRDRKRLLRTVIADVTVLPTQDKWQVRIGVRWHTGKTDELTVARKGPGRTPATALEIVRRHGARKTSAQLADLLNAAGFTTGKNRPYNAAAVARIRDTYDIPAPRTVAVADGELSVPEAAVRLGVSAKTVYYWIQHGLVPARRDEQAHRWCIPWDPDTQALYRRREADLAGRHRRTTRATAGGAV